MPKVLKEKVIKKEKLADSIYRLTVQSDSISQNALPGQFVNIKCGEGNGPVLRRPISICRVDRANRTFDVVFQVKGTGTKLLSQMTEGGTMDVLGPLGNPFEIPRDKKKIAVIGGGIGIFPLLFLLEAAGKEQQDLSAFIGFRNRDAAVLVDEFNAAAGSCTISTDDGSLYRKGFVTELFEESLKDREYDMIYTCGPTVMIKKVAETAKQNNIPCQVSMEQRMGCGIGACLVCACKTKHGDDWEYSHVCKDGPVFWSDKVLFEE